MKNLKIVLFSALALGLTLTSCGDDDSSSTGGKLEGTWIVSKEGMAANGQEALVDHEHTTGCDKDHVEISATKIKDVTFYNDGDGCKDDSSEVTYTRSGNTLTITEGTETYTGTIEKLTGSELRISNTEEGIPGKFIVVYTRK